jgi:hypothetical protein
MPSLAICASPRISTSRPRALQALHAGGEFLRMQDVGRLGDQVAAEQDGVGDGFQGGERLLGLGRIGGGHLDHADRRLLLGLLVVRYLSKR